MSERAIAEQMDTARWRELMSRHAGPFVYAIGSHIKLGAPVKIGVAKDPESRLRTLQTGNHEELRLLAVNANTTEREFHEIFGHLRIRGEWFRIDEELVEWLTGEWGYE